LDLTTSGTGEVHEFFRVTDATRLADGTIVVANRGSAEIRAYTPQGDLAWRVGREGGGPGEFRYLSQVARFRADSLVAFDYSLGRTTVLSQAGTIGRLLPPFSLDVRSRELLVLNNDTFAVVLSATRSAVVDRGGLHRPLASVVRVASRTGELIDTVGSYPAVESFLAAGAAILPLYYRSGHVTVRDGHLLVGTADSMEYRIYTGAGELTEIVRVPGYDLALSAEEVAAERAARLPSDRPVPPEYREAVASLPSPQTRPAYQEFLVDELGHVWAASYHGLLEADTSVEWQVFAATGEWLGGVIVPARFTVFEIGADYVLGQRRDSLDVERVQLLKLHR
jgi:hypothetical protein